MRKPAVQRASSALSDSDLQTARNRKPLDIDRVAWLLMRKFGPCAEQEAVNRMSYCAEHIDERTAREWRVVADKIRTLQCQRVPMTTH
jgi:hypothetical protein